MENDLSKQEKKRNDRALERTLSLSSLFLLLLGCMVVLRPFLTSILWAIILGFSLWPIHRWLTNRLRGRRSLSALIMTMILAALLGGPLVWMGITLADDVKAFGKAGKSWVQSIPDKPPEWMTNIPFAGSQVESYWEEFVIDREQWIQHLDKTAEKLAAQEAPFPGPTKDPDLAPPPQPVTPSNPEVSSATAEESRFLDLLGKTMLWTRSWLIETGLAIGQGFAQILLSVFLTFFILRDGTAVAARISVGAHRIAGERGLHLLKVAGDTTRGVVYGVLGTGIAQGVLAGVGFLVAGVPGAVLLGILCFLLSILLVGTPIVWVPVAIWLFSEGSTGWGIFMLIWGMGVSSIDNFLRPYLISQGSKMPFLLILLGVLGGALAYGLVGVFIGPILLAVTFRMIEQWSAIAPETTEIKVKPGEIH